MSWLVRSWREYREHPWASKVTAGVLGLEMAAMLIVPWFM